jgi:hypothetical protein
MKLSGIYDENEILRYEEEIESFRIFVNGLENGTSICLNKNRSK